MLVSSNNNLFSRYSLEGIIHEAESTALSRVSQLSEAEVLRLKAEDYLELILSEIIPTIPELRPSEMYIEQEGETTIDVSRTFEHEHDGPGPHVIIGQRVVIAVPFSGEANVLNFKRRYSSNSISATVRDDVILITFAGTSLDGAKIVQEAGHLIEQINERLKWISNDYLVLRQRLERDVPAAIEGRRSGSLHRKAMIDTLKLPMKRSSTPAPAFELPVVRKQRPISVGSSSVIAPQLPPEPELAMEEYEYILTVIERLGMAIERNPTVFSKMAEEEIRDIILVDLNGHYDGGASGETFNSQGKTDILVTEAGRAAFVAECKVWSGSKALNDAIDQILGYLTWRNTKTALLLFSRNKGFGSALETARSGIKAHPNFVRQVRVRNETSTTYEFRLPQDETRLIALTMTMFDIPPAKG